MQDLTLKIFLASFLMAFIDCRDPFPFGLNDRPDPFSNSAGLRNREVSAKRGRHTTPQPQIDDDQFSHHNEWGFEESGEAEEKSSEPSHDHEQAHQSAARSADTTSSSSTLSEEQQAQELQTAIRNAQLGITTTDLPPDPRHNGLLKDVGTVGVGFGVGVGVPGNDPVSVGTGVSVGLGESGPAGGLPWFLETVFPRPGEQQSLNDYDGNKDLIQSGKAYKYVQAARLGFIKIPQYAPAKSLVGVNSGIGILGAQAPSGG